MNYKVVSHLGTLYEGNSLEEELLVDKPWGDYVPKDSNMSYEDVDMTETLVEIFNMRYYLQNNVRGVG